MWSKIKTGDNFLDLSFCGGIDIPASTDPVFIEGKTDSGILINECDFVSENQNIGKSIKHMTPLHRIRQIQSHIVVYKIDKDQVSIDRFLHRTMDIETRLKP